jgi:hypothetical protein
VIFNIVANQFQQTNRLGILLFLLSGIGVIGGWEGERALFPTLLFSGEKAGEGGDVL